ncbi:MAG: YerC/YecD family TrpR-related protein [Pseudobdellovibrionaceae bacterium]|jgi:TrpR-related protein YerC/YecD
MSDIYSILSKLGSKEQIKVFLQDLCTPKEISDMNDRWKAAQLISEGLPYRDIYEKTGVSTTTVTRVARSLSEGKGYKKALALIKTSKKEGQ